MTAISYLQGIGVRHLFTLSNEGTNPAQNYGDSVDPTNISGGTYSFVTAPVCYGVTHCARSTTSTNENVDGTLFANRQDINANGGSSTYDWATGTKQVFFWARQKELFNVTCLYEQGGGVNNLAFMGGARSTWQAADAGQPFLIAASKTLSQKDRAILHWGGWEYRAAWGGADNRIWYTENGVMQGYDNQGGTQSFPGHSGDIVIGNSSDSLKTFNENTLISETVAQDSNFLGMRNNPPVLSINEGDIFPEAREFFERTVLPEVLIDADTVANQQAALDALSGTTYQNVNCAIEIRQATDATDYALELNNIQFVQNPNLRDIAVKYVGPNTLTLINNGTSNAEITAAPAEQDLDGTTVLTGGGSVVIENPAVLTIANVIAGAALTIFDDEDPDPQALGTILASEAAIAGTTYQFNHSKAGDDIVVQMIAAGYEEINQMVALTANDQAIVLEPKIEVNI